MGEPVPQLMLPVAHGLAGEQLAPPEHAVHEPELHTPPGQAVPLVTLPVSVQTAEPVAQLMAPVRHTFAGEQPAPLLHGLHPPLRHTPPAHGVPLLLLLPSVQTGLPVLQEVLPFRQAWPGFVEQPAPSLHALQVPLLQTPPGHPVPLGLFALSTHCGEPVEHETMPVRQALEGLVVHEPPATQLVQEPLLHTPPAQAVPFIRAEPSMHCWLPVEHEKTPKRQSLLAFVLHDPPLLQGLQAPPLQTPPMHEVPLERDAPSTQTGEPPLQSMTP